MVDRIIFISSIILIIVSAIGLFFYFLLKGHREWKEKVYNSPTDRMLKTKKNFIEYYMKKGYSEKSISFVYDNTQKFLRAKDIVLLPNDNFITVYERQQDEWFWAIEKWFKKYGRQQPDQKRLSDLLTKYNNEINFEYLIELVDN